MSQASEPSRPPLTTPKASLQEVERRHSERLMISVHIRVEGVDRNRKKFSEDSQTIIISRHGARIYLKRMVAAGSILLISTTGGRRSAKFRVVGPTQPLSSEGGEWGVECQDPECNIWGIGFPPASSTEGMCAAMIECQRCHAVKLSRLSMVEHEVLGISGLLIKECEACGRATSWSYREPSLPLTGDDAGLALPNPESFSQQPTGSNRRIHNRVALQLPLRVRSYYGAEEFTRTENVSRSGLCFVTDRNYEIGEIILITCPYEQSIRNIEVRGHVVSRREMQATRRKIYGVRYER